MLHKMPEDDFDHVIRVHVRGTFLGMREAARVMKAAGTPGTIINVTSSAGLDGTIGQINYSAAKGAIIAMTKSAARELARSSIRVNAISPAAATRMTETLRNDERFSERYLARVPLARWAEPRSRRHSCSWRAPPRATQLVRCCVPTAASTWSADPRVPP
jgi:3-oxoacyl-[acyl-carrier protein] reductase